MNNTNQIIAAIEYFLDKTTVEGKEVPTFVECRRWLNDQRDNGQNITEKADAEG